MWLCKAVCLTHIEVYHMMYNINWLFFDIGSTIIDESLAYSHRYRDIAHISNVSYSYVSEKAEALYRNGKKGDKEVARLLNVPVPSWHPEDERLYPDAAECLKKLHKKYKIGIIANQIAGTKERLRNHNILQFFDIIIASAEEGCAKPEMRIFEIALERSNCPPQNAIMIGDRIDNDIIPAKRLGMKTIWIKQGYGKYWIFSNECELPDLTVHSLSELSTIL